MDQRLTVQGWCGKRARHSRTDPVRTLYHSAGKKALAWALTLTCYALPASAVDVWTTPNPGIRHLHRTTPAPAEFHALVIDLDVPGVQIRCTPPRERWKSTSAYARDANLSAAMNGGFWGLFGQGAEGLAAGGGQIWGSDDAEHGFFAVTATGRAFVSPPSDVVQASRRRITDGVSGRPMIVDSGHIAQELYTFPRTFSREPRSAVGVSEDGRKVILVTVDGRRATSHGGTLTEMAELMIELGASRAINLDGGGSTTMYVSGEGGVVNRPSRGWEREVINHIGVLAPAPVAAAAAAPVVQPTPAAVVAEAERARRLPSSSGDVEQGQGTGMRGWLRAKFGRFAAIDRLHLGRNREVVVPVLSVAAVLFVLSGMFWVVSRVRRARSRSLHARES